ncbi:hypothetical protein ACFL27_22310 [candidate division CSSED10-310 bacterium]|uniref:Lipoprotein n=1 Tax=candidate division CSSED10-310 bacterium TaxID=2855610 RepID=A0ABV6Z3B4_UNCC1
MRKKLVRGLILFALVSAFIVGCPADDEEEFIDFYNPDSGCDTSIWVYDYYGKETRVTKDEHRLYIDDDDCLIANSEVIGLNLYIDNTKIAVVRCGYTTNDQCRFFWVHHDDGRFIIITGNCTNGYKFNYSEEVYNPCHN